MKNFKSKNILIFSCIILILIILVNFKKINKILNEDDNNENKKIVESFDTNKVRNSSRVLYEYEYQAEDDFPGSVYEEGLVEKYKDNPVLLCNLIPIFTKNVCSINNNPIIKYKYPISMMKLPNGNVLSVFNDGRMYEKNKIQDRMWNGPLKNSLPNKKIPLRMVTLNTKGTILYGIGYDNLIYAKPENEQQSISTDSEWELVIGIENVIFLMFKFEESKNYSRIIIINSEGQIKISNTDKFNSGFQNYGVITTPVVKLMYTYDNYMMAITNKFELRMFDNKEWESSDFSSKYGANPNNVLDVMYDYDELLFGIVILPNSNSVEIMKQEDSFPVEPFVPLEINRFKDSNINIRMSDKQIIKSKMGVSPYDNILDEDTLDNDINIAHQKQILKDKERLRKFCLAKGLGKDINYKNYDILKEIDSNNEQIEKLNKVILNLIKNDPNKKKIQESIEGINFISQQPVNVEDNSESNLDNTNNSDN